MLVTSIPVAFVIPGAGAVAPAAGDTDRPLDVRDDVQQTGTGSADAFGGEGDRSVGTGVGAPQRGRAASATSNDTPRGNTGHEPWYLYFRGVNTANGNLFISERDVSIGARGGDITFTRSYNSNLSAHHGPLGFGWTHNYNMQVRERSDGSVVFFDADGSTHVFTQTGDGYEAPPGVHSRLTANGSGYDLRRKTGHKLVFDAAGILQHITDKNGNTVHLEYTGGKLTTIRDDSGQQLTLTYNDQGRISTVTDPLGRTIKYRYDAGDLVEVVDVMGNSFRYDYYENHKMKRTDTPTRPPIIYTYYTGSDRVRCVGNGLSGTCAESGYIYHYDYANDTVRIVNGLVGNETLLELNTDGTPVLIDTSQGRTEMAWDDDMNRVLLRNASGTYRFAYDAYGNLIRETDNIGDTARMGWETIVTDDTYISLLMNRTSPRGFTTKYRYDTDGNRIKVINPRGETRQLQYNQFGYKTSETDFAGHTTRYTYNENGFRTAVISPIGAVTNYTYDAAGRMVSRTDPRGNTERFERNARGDIIKVIDPTGNTTEYNYDDTGTLLSAETATGRTIAAGAPWQPPPATGATFKRGNQSTTTRTSDHTLTRQFDSKGRSASVTVDFGPFTRRLNYTYEGGNLVTVRAPGGTIRYEYDDLDRITRIEGPNGTWVNYTYNAANMRTKEAYSNGVTTYYEYDAAGQLLNIRTEHPNGSVLLNYTYTYDAAGNRLTATDTDGDVARYRYDALDRLINVTYSSGKTVAYTYDAVGHRLSRTLNGTQTTEYIYNQEGELQEVRRPGKDITYQYDTDGNLIEKQIGTNTTRYTYDLRGRLQNVSQPDGDQATFTYLPSGQRLSKTTGGETTYYLYSFFDVVAAFHGNGSLARQYLHGPGIDEPVSLIHDDETYFYLQNGPMNVRALTNENGRIVNRYRYAPFGELERASEKVTNPYRYTGRRYDAESGLYYNRHRYYDPQVGRFTKRDPAGLSAGVNLYGYADNNPVNFRDPSGLDAWTGLLQGGGFMAAMVGFGIYSGQLVNVHTGQVCSVNIYNLKIGIGFGAAGGIQGAVQSGPHCGSNLGGSSLSAYAAAAGGAAMGSVSAGEGGASATGGAGASGGLTLEGGVSVGEVTVNGCTCVCKENEDEPVCPASCGPDECDDNDDSPDDNHDLSVMSYTRQYPGGGEGAPTFSYQGASVAVLSRGFSAELSDFLVTIDETPASVGFRASQERLNRFNVLVVPSGGFEGISTLPSLERKLDRYVAQGGTLVVMPQQHGYHLEPVPGDLAGFGWREDQSCQFASVGVTNFCSVVASQTDSVANVNVDGYFTEWPENATILLTRTKNGQPAMLKYRHGAGRVLATAAYTDWAYGHHASHSEGRMLLRDMVRWAKQPGNISTYGPGERITLSTNVTSYIDVPADDIRIRLIDPSGNAQQTINLSGDLSTFASRNITFTATIPKRAQRGLWGVEYSLVNDSHSIVQRGRSPGHFAVSTLQQSGEGWTYQRSNLSFSVTSSAEHFARGSNASFTITVWNRGATEENVTVWWSFPHNLDATGDSATYGRGRTTPGQDSNLSRTLRVPAGGKRTIAYQVPVYAPLDRLWAEFYRGNRSSEDYLGRTSKGFFTFRPSIDIDAKTDETRYAPGGGVTLNLSVQNDTSLRPTVDVRVLDPENRPVYDEQVNVSNNSDGTWRTSLEFTLPPSATGGHYTVIADSQQDGQRIGYTTTQFAVPSPIPGITPSLPNTIQNGSQVGFTIENLGRRNLSNATLSVSLAGPAGTEVWNDSTSVDVQPGEQDRHTFELRTGAGALSLGTYRLRYALAYGNGSRATRIILLSNELTATVDFDRPSYDAGETAHTVVAVTNAGRFSGSQNVSITIPEIGFSETRQLQLAPGESTPLDYTISLPGTISGGKHGLVTLEMANTVTRELGLFVRPSKLSISTLGSRYDAGDDIEINLTNRGGASTTADCSVVLYGPRGRTIYENRTRLGLGQGQSVALTAALNEAVVGGSYFVSTTCENENRGTKADLLKSVSVSGLNANVSSTSDKQVYTRGENVTITATIDNLDGAIRNGTLTVQVVNASAREQSASKYPFSTSSNTETLFGGEGGKRSLSRQTSRDETTERPRSNTTSSTTRVLNNVTDVSESSEPPDPWNDTQDGNSDGTDAFAAGTQVDDEVDVTAVGTATTTTTRNLTIGNDTVWQDRTIVLNRSLVVNTTGNLTLINTTLVFNNSADGEFGTDVRGGAMHVLSESNISTIDGDHHFTFEVAPGSDFEMRDSDLSQAGYSGSSNQTGLYIEANDTVIENSTFTQSRRGIVLNGSHNSTVTDNKVFSNTDDGIRVHESDGVRLSGNTLFDNGYEESMVLVDSASLTVVANNVSGYNDKMNLERVNHSTLRNNTFDESDLYADYSNDNSLYNNTVKEYGTFFFSNSDDNTITNNTIGGVWLDTSDSNIVSNNTHNAEESSDIDVSSSDGNTISHNAVSHVDLDDSDANDIRHNNLSNVGSSLSPVRLQDSDFNTIHNNTISDGETGIGLVRSGNNTVTRNDVSRSSKYGIYLAKSPNTTVRNNTVSESDIHDFFVDGTELGHFLNDVENNELTNGSLVYWVNRSNMTVPSDAGAVWLVNDTNVTVTGGETVALAFTNHSRVEGVNVSGGVVQGFYGIYLYRASNNTVINSTARNTDYGIYLENAPSNRILDNNMSSLDYGQPIFLKDTNGSVIRDNEAVDTRRVELVSSGRNTLSRNDFSGTTLELDRAHANDVAGNSVRWASLYYSHANDLTNNTIHSLSGLSLSRSDRNNLTRNDFTRGHETFEYDQQVIELYDSNGNILLNNTVVVYEDGHGIYVYGSESNRLVDNNVSKVVSYANGIHLEQSDDSRIAGNTVSGGDGTDGPRSHGIVLRESSNNNTLADNDLSGNDGHGIYIYRSSNGTLRNNSMADNEWNGLFVQTEDTYSSTESDELRYYVHDIDSGNTVHGEPVYYWLNRSDATVPSDAGAVWLVNNTNVTVAGGTSAALVFTTGSTVRGIDASGKRYGVYLENASGNVVTDSVAKRNEFGIRTEDAANVTITDSKVTNNSEYGIYFEDIHNGSVRRNNVSLTNARYGEEAILLSGTNHTTVARNRLLDNSRSVVLRSSYFNEISGNDIEESSDAIRIYNADNNTVGGNEITKGYQGIQIDGSDYNTILNNTVFNYSGTGIEIGSGFDPEDDAENNTIYNNIIASPRAFAEHAVDADGDNRWNVTKRPGENIVGGPYIGGNYWGDYDGKDLDGDGLGDTKLPYNSSGHIYSGGDYHPLIPPEPAGPVVWSTNASIDVSANATKTMQFTVPASALSNVTGKLKLASKLASRINQTIDTEDPSFYVIDSDTIVTLEADKPVYKPGETVTLSGVVENTGDSTRTYTLSVSRNDTEIETRSLTLDPGENDTYSVTTSSAGTFTATATAGNTTITDRVQVSAPSVNTTITAPDVVGRDAFEAGVLLENTGDVPATLNVSIANRSQGRFTLAPGESRLVERSMQVDSDTALEVTISGDVNTTLTKQLTFGERVDVTVSPKPAYTPGSVRIPYTVENTGDLESAFNLTVSLDGRTIRKDIYLAPESDTSGTLRFNLSAGEHTLTYATPFGTHNATVRVAERNQVDLDATTGAVTDDGRLPVTVTVENTGPNDVYGTLRANSSVFVHTRGFDVSSGASRTVQFEVDLPEGAQAGTYDLDLEAISEGEVVANGTTRFEVPAPRFEVVGAPSPGSYRIGDRVSLNLTVENVGGAEGQGRVNVSVPGIHQARPTVWLTPGERANVTVSFLLPDDLETGRYDVEYGANGDRSTTSLFVEGLNVSAAAALDKPVYEAGENATLTLNVTNHQPMNASLYSRVHFNAYDETKNYTLAGGENATVTFEVPIEFGGDEKIFYSVYAESGRSLYINGLRPHRNQSKNVTLHTDEPVYDIGDTVRVNLTAHAAGDVAVSAPGLGFQETLSAGATRNLNFTVPTLKSGTYYVHYSFENRSHSYAFDVDGYHAQVFETAFEGDSQTAGEGVNLTLTVAPNRDVWSTVTARVYDSQNREIADFQTGTWLSGKEDTVTLQGDLPRNASGIHYVVYRIVADVGRPIELVRGTSYFEVQAAQTAAAGAFSLSNVTAPPVGVAGRNVTVTTTVQNLDPVRATRSVSVRLDGTTLASRNVTVAAGGTTTATFDVRVPEGTSPGQRTVTVAVGNETGTTAMEVLPLGDASGDGITKSGDASTVLRRVVGLPNPRFEFAAADINRDGEIKSGDATLVLRIVVGLPL